MKNLSLFSLLCLIVMITACKKNQTSDNPFLSEYNTPFEAPPFDKIDTTHYMPAFLEGMKQQMAEIDAIVKNTEEPNFENTILAFDKSGLQLSKVSKVFYNISEADITDHIQKISKDLSPLMSKHRDDIGMNPGLFEKIKFVYNKRNEMKLDAQQLRVVEKYYKDFVRKGADLPKDKQAELRKINEELSMLSIRFGENLLAETNKNFKLVIDKKEDLAGLPESVIEGAAAAAKEQKMEGKWVFGLSKPSMIPFLQYSAKRELREKIYRGYFMRGDNSNANDNKEIVAKITSLRSQFAKLLGYKDFASYVIEENMAKTPANVDTFLDKLWKAALPVAKEEAVEMQKIIDKEKGGFKLQPWDWWYYAEKLRKEKYDLDENELKPYFSLINVRDGMFAVAKKLYGISFTRRTDIPLYHKDVETWEAKDKDGSHLGILYLDYFPRDTKRGGAWCTDFRSAGMRDGKKVTPLVSLVLNFTPPAGETPSLLSWDEVTTLFHEFGHGLHSLFAQGAYDRTAGMVPQDYVELPSQIMENWASDPEVIKSYAKHYKTNEVIPDALIAKINNSSLFNQGFVTLEYVAASILDMDYHKVTDATNLNVNEFEKAAMGKIGLIPEILPRYRSTYFSHIFNGGYAAGYYVYLWAAVLDADAFDAFKSSGDVYNQELAAKFRKYCLAESGDDDGMIQYKKFRGKDPDVSALLKRRGLN